MDMRTRIGKERERGYRNVKVVLAWNKRVLADTEKTEQNTAEMEKQRFAGLRTTHTRRMRQNGGWRRRAERNGQENVSD